MKSYQNLDIDLTDYQKVDDRESLRAKVVASPAGEQIDQDAPRVSFPDGLRDRIGSLELRELKFDELILLGEDLASLLLPQGVREFYERSLENLGKDVGLRIRIRPHDPKLAALPWEYIYIQRSDVNPGRKGSEGFLALDERLSLVRYEIMKGAPDQISPMEHYDIRAIALLSEVEHPGFADLDLKREEDILRGALEGLAGIDTEFLRPGSHDQLRESLNKDAQVFHFSGHGLMKSEQGLEFRTTEDTGQLVFSGDNNQPDPKDASTLGLQLKRKGIRLVVLNACEAAKRDPVTPWSGIASTLMRQNIPAVVGMQYTIRDDSALEFSRSFYNKLASGESIDSAVSKGRMDIFARNGEEDGARDWGVPVLYMRSSQSDLFPPPTKTVRLNLFLATVIIVLLAPWFFFHIYPLVANRFGTITNSLGLGVGAIAGLIAVWKMWQPFVVKSAKFKRGSVFERWPHHRHTKWVLIFLFLASSVLILSTSSIYLKDDSPTPGTFVLTVQPADGHSFSPYPNLTTSPDKTYDGGPIFRFPWLKKLELELVPPDEWTLKENKITIGPLSRPVSLSVPSKADPFMFTLVKRIALRLVPGPTLLRALKPHTEDKTDNPHELRITIGNKPKPHILKDLRKGIVWSGGDKEFLTDLINEDRKYENVRDKSLASCLSTSQQNFLSDFKRDWDAQDKVLETVIIKSNDEFTIEVIDLNNSDKPFYEKTFKAEDFEGKPIVTICLPEVPK